jgi:hypothetical protein
MLHLFTVDQVVISIVSTLICNCTLESEISAINNVEASYDFILFIHEVSFIVYSSLYG